MEKNFCKSKKVALFLIPIVLTTTIYLVRKKIQEDPKPCVRFSTEFEFCVEIFENMCPDVFSVFDHIIADLIVQFSPNIFR